MHVSPMSLWGFRRQLVAILVCFAGGWHHIPSQVPVGYSYVNMRGRFDRVSSCYFILLFFGIVLVFSFFHFLCHSVVCDFSLFLVRHRLRCRPFRVPSFRALRGYITGGMSCMKL